ncbi:7789_t:CDS:1, partial [Dentiscutata heterogama]
RGHQKRLEEELGNLSKKIKKIILNYAALIENRPKEPHGKNKWKNKGNQEKR